jgi:threonyl-tRNA synthetase
MADITGFDFARQEDVHDAVAVSYGGKLYDLKHAWPARTKGLTLIRRQDPQGLEILRHDAAHLMAQAVKELYPETQVTIGPAIDKGFYYDFYREESFSTDDLIAIEKRMLHIVKRNDPISREEWSRADALRFFEEEREHFKVEIIQDLPESEIISVYRQGDFIDLCRGPHLPSTGALGKAFKLLKLAGAYWRGDSQKPMLQRIYGTCWDTKEALDTYLHQLEEAAKNDHRKLGKDMELFHFQEEAKGSVFWHEYGWRIYKAVENYIRRRVEAEGYREISTPQLVSRDLWERSGHWEKFRDNMLVCTPPHENDEDALALKPMNCPCHIEVFKQGTKSYRDLPLRMAEFGSCIRYEPSGALMGLMRLRNFVQDDAHIFVTPDQISSETEKFCHLLFSVYKDFGFEDIEVKFADRPTKRAGEDAVWDEAEAALQRGAETANLTYTTNPGEGAFYGPKLEFVLKDAMGRPWQCGTLQVDFVLPQRLGATYIDMAGKKQTPVLLHRAILGSLERFIGVLIEHYKGKLPLWLAPIQVAVLPITNDFDSYGRDVLKTLEKAGVWAELDDRSQKIGYKIRALSLRKVPYLFIVGEREQKDKTVAVRMLGAVEQKVLSLANAVDEIRSLACPPDLRVQ